MANFWAVALAFAFNTNVIYFFTKAEDYDCFLYPTYLMLLIGVSNLLWDASIYPKNFRRLHSWCEFIIEVALVTFLMEFILIWVLLPLEKAFVDSMPSIIGEGIECFMSTAGLEVGCVNDFCELLKTDNAKMFASYIFGSFFLLVISYATRMIDLGILMCDGPGAFIYDAKYRTIQRFYQVPPKPILIPAPQAGFYFGAGHL